MCILTIIIIIVVIYLLYLLYNYVMNKKEGYSCHGWDDRIKGPGFNYIEKEEIRL